MKVFWLPIIERNYFEDKIWVLKLKTKTIGKG